MSATRSKVDMEGLARRMANLEDQAYRGFADIFGPRFRAYFMKKGGLLISDAEDLAASCITDIALKVDKYVPTEGGSFDAWVFTLARHALVDWWRKRKHQSAAVSIEDLPTRELPEVKPNMDIISAVEDAVAQLSEVDQTLIWLRDPEEELTYAEIAERLGISEGNARVRHLRALKRMESILEKDPRIQKLLKRGKN